MKLPYLNLWVDIWIIQIKTEIWNESYESLIRVWIGLHITLFHKWGFSFKLYMPERYSHK